MMRLSVQSRLLALLLATAVVAPSAAWAQDATADAATQAADYYNQATIAYQQGDYEKAAELLDLAFGKNPDLVYKYNRILALQAHGDFTKALSELDTMYGPMRADSQSRFDDIDQIKEQLQASVDAAEPEPEPELEPAPIAPPAEKGPNYLAWGLIGGGAVVLTTGVIFATGALVPSEHKLCVGIGVDTSEGEEADCGPLIEDWGPEQDTGAFLTPDEAREEADSVVAVHQVTAVTMMASGAVLGAVGAILLVLDNSDDGGETPPQSVQFTPYVNHDGAGAAMMLRF